MPVQLQNLNQQQQLQNLDNIFSQAYKGTVDAVGKGVNSVKKFVG